MKRYAIVENSVIDLRQIIDKAWRYDIAGTEAEPIITIHFTEGAQTGELQGSEARVFLDQFGGTQLNGRNLQTAVNPAPALQRFTKEIAAANPKEPPAV